MYSLPLLKKQLTLNNKGQGLVEYTLLVLLVALVFWLSVRDTNLGQTLQTAWNEVSASLYPFGGGSGEGSGGGPGGGDSGGGSGGSSGSGSGGSSGDGSFFGAAAAATNSSAASSTIDSTSRKENSYLAIWISLLFLTLIITLVIWRFIKAGRENEVQYQNLDTKQILGKIAKK